MKPRVFIRVIFGLLAATTVIVPVCFMIAASHQRGNPMDHLFLYIYVTQAATVALAIWSIIFVRTEPVLVRVAIVIILVVSYNTVWVHRL